MSNEVFPSLPGLTWNVVKEPLFNTKVQTSVNMAELRAAFANTPVYDFTLGYDVLREYDAFAELRSLGGFFLARQGRWDSFLFSDPTDFNVAGQQFGTGNGVATAFQLTRAFGAFREQVSQLSGAPQVYANGVLLSTPSQYNVSSTGLVTFASPPATNANLAWSGSYYFRCRFKEDVSSYNNFMRDLWELRSLTFRGSLGTKV